MTCACLSIVKEKLTKMAAFDDLRETFVNPPAQYRSIPFWAWNDRLDEEELVRQVWEMKKQGFGGFFIHSREGLETAYMGPEWMSCVRKVVQAAKEAGLQVWLYDEDRWPSGTAGGSVPAENEAFRAKGLTIEIRRDLPQTTEDIFALYKARVKGMELSGCEPTDVHHPGRLGVEESFLIFRVEVSRTSEWFNGQTPPDCLNPDTVQEFIRHTHERYCGEIGQEFGKTVPGIFSDEPSVHDRRCRFTPGRGWIPWTEEFPTLFISRRGWNIREGLPWLFFNGAKSSAARHDYWRTISELFCESFTAPISRWCGDHHLKMTGHYLWENKLGIATRVSGSVMPNYRYEQVPGIDLLGEQIDEVITAKQCASVATQFGKNEVIAETYGCTGWEFDFEGQKWIGDWMAVLGITRRCQHLALYSLRGCRKRDYPPSFNYHTPQWKYSHIVEDYFARIATVTTRGKAVRDILVIHPAATAWSMLGSDPYGFVKRGMDRDIPGIDHYGDQFNDLLRDLLAMHYDFDLGDESILAQAGKVCGSVFRVQMADYRVIIIPPVKTLLKSTVALLTKFLDAGGKVLVMEPLPSMAEGRQSNCIRQLTAHEKIISVSDQRQLMARLQQTIRRRVGIEDGIGQQIPQLLYMLRDIGDRMALFVVNTDRVRSFEADIELDFSGGVQEWDPMTGEIRPMEAKPNGAGMTIAAHFGPTASRLYLLDRNSSPISAAGANPRADGAATFLAALGPSCRFSRTAPNALTLDWCRYRIREEPWSGPMEVWQAQKEIRDRLGMRPVYANGIAQRYRWIDQPYPQDGASVQLAFEFETNHVPVHPVRLAMESPEDYRIMLNGDTVSFVPDGWFLDRSFITGQMPGLKEGRNELVLDCRYFNRMEMENIYLIGDFGVSPSRRIGDEPERLHFGDWCMQGYFHYCGGMVYHFDVELPFKKGDKVVLRPGQYAAVMLEVRVNGKTAGTLPWRAVQELDISPYLHNGHNCMDVEVTGSARNMLGPFHQAQGHMPTTSCGSFIREGSQYTPDYIVKPYGLFDQIQIYRVL